MDFLTDIGQKTLWVGLGGFLGANARFWLGSWIQQRFGGPFPLGTFIVNISGAFVLGLFVALMTERFAFSNAPALRLIFAVGFVGAYTTFSTFEYETFALIETGAMFYALANIILSVIAGFVAVWLGVALGRIV